MIKKSFVLLMILMIGLYAQEKKVEKEEEKKPSLFKKTRVFFQLGGSMVFLSMKMNEYTTYYRKALHQDNARIKKDYDFIGGGGYFGASYVALDHLATGGILSAYTMPSVDIHYLGFNKTTGVAEVRRTYIHRTYVIISHELEGFALPYRKTRFNIGFLLNTGLAFNPEIRSENVDGSKNIPITKNHGVYFALAPAVRIHVNMNEFGGFHIGYRQWFMINTQVYHFGTLYMGLDYTVEFKKKEEREQDYEEQMRLLRKRNI